MLILRRSRTGNNRKDVHPAFEQAWTQVLSKAINSVMFAVRALAASALIIGFAAHAITLSPAEHPLAFFEGSTEGVSTTKIMTRKPYHSRTVGKGKILADGSLFLVQRVTEDDRSPFERRWRIRKVGAGKFSGEMSEAVGPVEIVQIGSRFRFRYKLKKNVSIEQWIIPEASGDSVKSDATIRKFGVVVGTSKGSIKKVQNPPAS